MLTLYYGASKDEMLSNSFTYSQAVSKRKENITRLCLRAIKDLKGQKPVPYNAKGLTNSVKPFAQVNNIQHWCTWWRGNL